jgi:predicted DNA-binding antitoxin AbrB/MazE fold protein
MEEIMSINDVINNLNYECIEAIYDGQTFQPLEPIPVKTKCKVKILFEKKRQLKNVDNVEERLAAFSKLIGTWDNSDIALMEEMVDDRKTFFKKTNHEDN